MSRFFWKRKILVQSLYSIGMHHAFRGGSGGGGGDELFVHDVIPDLVRSTCGLIAIEKECELGKDFIIMVIDVLSDLVKKQDSLDHIITNYLKSDWKWDRVATVVRTILRLGSYEIIVGSPFTSSRSGGAIISDYVDVAVQMSHNVEAPFINGLLDNVLKNDVKNGEESV